MQLLVRGLVERVGAFHALPDKGMQGWGKSLALFDCEGYQLARCYFGGRRDDVHLVSTSAAADLVRGDVVAGEETAKTSRVDTRVDTLVPFEELEGIMRDAAVSYGSLVTTVASERGGVSLGRTMYLGAPSSAVRVRLYEKWLESPGEYEEGTNRVEVQCRPASRAKVAVSAWSRAETFCASRVTRDLAQRLGADLAPAASLHVKRGTPELEQTIEAMGNQYGRAARQWMEVSGGDLERLLERLTLLS